MALALMLVERQTFLELKLDDDVAFPARRQRALTDSCCSLGHADLSSDSDCGIIACNSTSACQSCFSESWADTDIESEFSASPAQSECSVSAAELECWALPAGPPGFFASPENQKHDESVNSTTLVIKQLPDGCTQDAIEVFMKAQGLDRSCNFLYAPTNFRKGTLFGYCFVNFVSPAAARRAFHQLSAETTPCGASNFGQLEVSWSETHQGLDAQIERYRNCPVMHRLVPDAYKPRLYVEGKIARFPEPTESVQLPRGLAKGGLRH